MLGLRKINGCQIDLWCGDPADFVTDSRLVINKLPDEFSNSISTSLTDATGRHCGVVIKQNSADLQRIQLKRVFTDIELLTKKSGQPLQRLTFIFSELEAYKVFQRAFFAYFPDQFSE